MCRMALTTTSPRAVPPSRIVTAAEPILGADVIAFDAISGGYTTQHLARLTLSDGTRAVLKAAAPGVADRVDWGLQVRREIDAYRAWPFLAPWRPRMRATFVCDGWTVLVTEEVAGAARIPPWTAPLLDAVGRGLAGMHAASAGWPGDVPAPRDHRFHERVRRAGRDQGDLPASWAGHGWWAWLDRVLDAAGEAAAALVRNAPPRLLHYGVRSDNLFVRDGRLVLVDWPIARWGAQAIDSAHWAVSVEAEGGPDAPRVHARYLAHAPEAADQTTGAVAYVAGWLLCRLVERDGPDRVQRMRLRLLRPALRWLGRRLDVEAPTLP